MIIMSDNMKEALLETGIMRIQITEEVLLVLKMMREKMKKIQNMKIINKIFVCSISKDH